MTLSQSKRGSEPPPPSSEDPGRTRAFVIVWMALFLNLVAFGIVIPVLPFYALHFGASPKVVTLLSTTFSLGQFLMSPVLGRLSDRIGRRPVMLISLAGSTVAMVILGFAQSLAMVFAARIVSGVSSANISTAQAYVADRVRPVERARYMGMMGAAIGMGFVFGPALGGVLSLPGHPELPFLVAAGLNGVTWLLAVFFLPESRRPAARRKLDTDAGSSGEYPGPAPQRTAALGFDAIGRSIQRLRGTALGWLVLVSFCFYLSFSAMESTFALLMEANLDWGARETGYLFTGIGLVIAITQGVLVGRLVGFMGEKRVLVTGLLVLAAGLATTGLAYTPLSAALGAVGIAGGNGLIVPSVSTLISRLSSEHEQGLNLGLNASGGSAARVVGPVIAGLVFETIGAGVPMLGGSVIILVAALLAAIRIDPPTDDDDPTLRTDELDRPAERHSGSIGTGPILGRSSTTTRRGSRPPTRTPTS